MRSFKGVHWALFFLFLAMVGCASVSGYRQPVLVTSDPAGANVYDLGEFLGTTPSYMRVRRRPHPVLEFHYPDKSIRLISLKSHYRWYDSFFGNLLLLPYAPIGWAVDWWTGTAWHIEDPPIGETDLPGQNVRLAIAPPAAAEPDMSDSLGLDLEEKLRKENRYKIVPYEQTLPHFDYYNTKSFLPIDRNDRTALLGNLHADAVLLSKASEEGDRVNLTGEIRNIYSGGLISEPTWNLSVPESQRRSKNGIGQYFHLLPNTIFANFSDYSSNLKVGGVEQRGAAVSDGSTFEGITRYVGAIGIARLQRPRRNVIGRWTTDFVPSLNFSSKRIRYQLLMPAQDQDFDRIYASGGYGLEVGYLYKYGFPYFDIIPQFVWTKLTYDVAGVERKRDRVNFTAGVEFGYLYFFSDHFIAKLYTRTLQEDPQLWQAAVSDIYGRQVYVESAASIFSGIAFGYYFPEGAKKKSQRN